MSVISPDKTHSLTREQIEFYQDNGYLHVANVFTEEEATFLRDEAHGLLKRHLDADSSGTSFGGWGSAKKVADGPMKLFHCHNVQFQSSAFARMIVDPRFTDRIADLIGPNIQLHHTKMFIKPPEQGAPFPMHQDYPYFPHENDTMIAAIVHLDDAPLEKGCVRVAPGSHKLGPMDHLHEGGHHLSTDEYPVAEATALPAKAGDVLVFSYLTAHGSGVNVSGDSRTTVLVQMRDPADRPMTNGHLSRGQGMMLRGFDPEADAGTGVGSESRYLRETYGD
ncbi:phytanoyl-CoA dioxygenase family protein [Candidatus Poribacteria bacterium]|jgi:phytanoyl-CoA hydroxylase|nr:phytanoyl-CoA dioxygenase family protein [Candidatus Poribacteria bacterium]MBT5532984.1 phytanoyl-CoA dioxygenase family protein [Candidatus Poribacteria bacterium]MBT5712592.1 phytanoyl-CoA dioxygenase family protein [Candidatus Poribacteria bacterium]MBT7096221.1 phytanoyl-CoA dioxygenase family protein [Candidatus Poribacteria bacterium]MBT7805490.1 phytanoyl-CoA dioxygenase family protein [Candidatus Poribacteria bacterium]